MQLNCEASIRFHGQYIICFLFQIRWYHLGLKELQRDYEKTCKNS
jgi:hypothetical protein